MCAAAGNAPSGASISAGRRRSISASSASAPSSSMTVKRPADRSSQARPNRPSARAHASEDVVAAFLEQCLVGDGARRDDAHHLPLHRSLGLAGIAALFANGHGLALADQPCEIGIEGDRGYTRHRDGRAGRGTALGERDVEQLGGAPRVLVEHLVEIAHAIEQEHVRVLRLDAQVLLHHRGMILKRAA